MAIEKIAFITILDISKRIDLLLVREKVLNKNDYNLMKDGILEDILKLILDVTRKTDWDDDDDKWEWRNIILPLNALMLIDTNPKELEKPLFCEGVCVDDLSEEEWENTFSSMDDGVWDFNQD